MPVEEKLLWKAYRKSPMLFQQYHPRRPTASSSPRRFATPTQNCNCYYLRNA